MLEAPSFTKVVMVLHICGARVRWLAPVAASCSLGVLVSFTCAPLFDDTVYRRMRADKGWNSSFFYVGHFLVHVLPAIYGYLCYVPSKLDAACAVILHVAWFSVADLNRIYVPLPDHVWLKLMWIATLTELAAAA